MNRQEIICTGTSDHSSLSGRLSRRLGMASCLFLVIGVVAGSGIFRVPSPIAAAAGNLTGITIVWLLGGVLTMFAALSVAELATMFPLTGGPYVYLREGYGRPLGFLYGWMELVTGPIGSAAKAMIFVGYLSVIVPMSVLTQHVVGAVMLLLVGAVNYRSLGLAAAVQNLSTATKLAALLILCGAIFWLVPNGAGEMALGGSAGSPHWMGIGRALVIVMFAYEGWQGVVMVAGEVKRPQRNLPVALIGGLLAVVALYIMINAAYFRALTVPEVIASKSVASDAARSVLGRAGAAVIAGLVMLSVFGTLNGGVMSGPRVLAAMADDDLFFSGISKVHKRYKTPYVAIMLSIGIAVIYIMFRNFTQLAQAYILAKWPFDALMVGAVFTLRHKQSDLPRPYRTIGYPIVPAAYIIATILVIGYIAYSRPFPAFTSIAITLLGIPLYFLWLYWRSFRRPPE